LPFHSQILDLPVRLLAAKNRAKALLDSHLSAFFESAQRDWLQRAHAERAAIADSRATTNSPKAVSRLHHLMCLPPPAVSEAERKALVSAAVDEGGLGHVEGIGAQRLITLVRGEGEGNRSTSFDSIIGNACCDAVSAALSSIDSRTLLPQPSAAVNSLFMKWGSLYVFHKGFAYRALSDGWSPYEEGKCTQQGESLPLPHAHEIAPDDPDSKMVRTCAPSAHDMLLRLFWAGYCPTPVVHSRHGCQKRHRLLYQLFRSTRREIWPKIRQEGPGSIVFNRS
jgi:hypothetical protein